MINLTDPFFARIKNPRRKTPYSTDEGVLKLGKQRIFTLRGLADLANGTSGNLKTCYYHECDGVAVITVEDDEREGTHLRTETPSPRLKFDTRFLITDYRLASYNGKPKALGTIVVLGEPITQIIPLKQQSIPLSADKDILLFLERIDNDQKERRTNQPTKRPGK